MSSFCRRRFLQSFLLGVGLSLGSCNKQEAATEVDPQASVKSNTELSADNTSTILILGAGAAGLAAAQRLQQNGYQVIVLEGRDRIGGRVWTDRSLGMPLDLGASWIHGIEGNPLSELVQRFTLSTQLTDYENMIRYQWQGQRLNDAKSEVIDERLGQLMSLVEQLREQQSQAQVGDISLDLAVQQCIPQMNLRFEEVTFLNYALNTQIEHEYAADLKQLSLNYWDDGNFFGGADVIFPDGYDGIIEGLAQGLVIRLGHRVQRVEYDNKGVRVQTDQGELAGRAAIATFPLGVLKQGKITFSPPLPERKQVAIRNLGMGVLNKVYFQFPTAFWEQNADMLGYVGTSKGEWAEFLNLYKYIGKPILLGFNAGEFGLAVESLSDRAIIQSGMAVLRTMYGDSIPDPISWLITRWNQDPFTHGSYSSIAPGATPDDRDVLAAPVGNTLFFAGEATSRDYAATVHGALLSGDRAAREVQQKLPLQI